MTSGTIKDKKQANAKMGGDTTSRERVAKYVKDMPTKIAAMMTQFNAQDYAALQIAARQLRESAGAYGFEQIIPCAEKLEKCSKGGQSKEEIRKALDELNTICNQIQTSQCC